MRGCAANATSAIDVQSAPIAIVYCMQATHRDENEKQAAVAVSAGRKDHLSSAHTLLCTHWSGSLLQLAEVPEFR